MKKWKVVVTIQIGFIAGVLFAISCGSENDFQSVAQGVLNALGVTYDNSASGLAATNVQTALDELAGQNKCPSDMVKTQGGFCIEKDTRAAANRGSAGSTCAAAGRHLCDGNGWLEGCMDQNDGSTIGMNGTLAGGGNAEWILTRTDGANGGQTVDNNATCSGGQQGVAVATLLKFRCCKSIPG